MAPNLTLRRLAACDSRMELGNCVSPVSAGRLFSGGSFHDTPPKAGQPLSLKVASINKFSPPYEVSNARDARDVACNHSLGRAGSSHWFIFLH